MINNKHTQRGFTLIELLVATAISVILGAGFLGMQYIFSSNQVSAWKSYHNVDEANRITAQISKELRNMHESETGSYPLLTASDQEIVFYSDVNLDGNVDRVRYTLSGSSLIKGVVYPTGEPLTYNLAAEQVQTLSQNIRNNADPLFYYYNEDWPTDTTGNPLPAVDRISDTKHIKLFVRTNVKTNNADNDFIIESEITIRMLRQS